MDIGGVNNADGIIAYDKWADGNWQNKLAMDLNSEVRRRILRSWVPTTNFTNQDLV